MATYKTPGVYVQEIATLPPSVAEVSTAIPAFIGCTANGSTKENDKIVPVVKRINTMLDYEMHFGGAYPSQFNVTTQLAPDNKTKALGQLTHNAPSYEYMLYDSLNLYFKNGGGPCYVVSIGNYDTAPDKSQFEAGLTALEKEDEPTLLLLTDAVALGAGTYYELCGTALRQCHDLGDRFTIVDVLESTDPAKDAVGYFRFKIGDAHLLYGAAYYPYLDTTLSYAYQEDGVTIDKDLQQIDLSNALRVTYRGSDDDAPKVTVVNSTDGEPVTFAIADKTLTITLKTGNDAPTSRAIAAAWKTRTDPQGFAVTALGDGSSKLTGIADAGTLPLQRATLGTLATIKSTNTALYNQIKSALSEQRIKLPPSPAIAGVYASVDRDRGVWKAPANVSLASVIGPVTKITDADQEKLNIDDTAGKSVNAIRAFTGKGTLVWGARTLAGNDNEWRYVSVRRLFNMIEESAKKASAFAVFEPNDATTWLKVKAMIESYLYGLWQQGALAGPTPEAAYFVEVGLNKTMSVEQIQAGLMIVKIGIAAVRPAEFMILSFTHKLQQA